MSKPDKLARRVRQLEDRHRRDIVKLRNELYSTIAMYIVVEPDELDDPAIRRRLREYVGPR